MPLITLTTPLDNANRGGSFCIKCLNSPITCKPFKNNHEDQLGLVQSFDWFEPTALQNIESKFHDMTEGSEFIDEKRKDRITFAFRERINMLIAFMNVQSKKRNFTGVSLSGDVHL